jgi:hypothetical protein
LAAAAASPKSVAKTISVCCHSSASTIVEVEEWFLCKQER